MNPNDLRAFVRRALALPTSRWSYEAMRALDLGHFEAITGRTDRDLYLLRLWLTPPRSSGERAGFDSGDSLLLHVFARGDDDQSLHDHPWDFVTTILTGGYTEHHPPGDWRHDRGLGPAWDAVLHFRRAGETQGRQAEDLHCVTAVLPGTVTLVRTHRRRRAWGFHPPGRRWIAYAEYLEERKRAVLA